MQHGVAEVDSFDDVNAVSFVQPPGQFADEIAPVHAHLDRQILCGGVEFVQVILSLVEVVPHLLVRHRDRSRAAARILLMLNRSSVAAAS